MCTNADLSRDLGVDMGTGSHAGAGPPSRPRPLPQIQRVSMHPARLTSARLTLAAA